MQVKSVAKACASMEAVVVVVVDTIDGAVAVNGSPTLTVAGVRIRFADGILQTSSLGT